MSDTPHVRQSSVDLRAFMATGEGYRAIRRAIADPGSVVRRKVEGPQNAYVHEDMTDWQTRAVMAMLGKVGRDA